MHTNRRRELHPTAPRSRGDAPEFFHAIRPPDQSRRRKQAFGRRARRGGVVWNVPAGRPSQVTEDHGPSAARVVCKCRGTPHRPTTPGSRRVPGPRASSARSRSGRKKWCGHQQSHRGRINTISAGWRDLIGRAGSVSEHSRAVGSLSWLPLVRLHLHHATVFEAFERKFIGVTFVSASATFAADTFSIKTLP